VTYGGHFSVVAKGGGGPGGTFVGAALWATL